MSGVPATDLKAYFAEARPGTMTAWPPRSARGVWPGVVAALAGVLACAAVASVAVLTPLKTIEPYVVRIDRTTGAVEVLRGLSTPGPVAYEESNT